MTTYRTIRATVRFCALSLLVLLGACDYSMMKDQPVSPQTGSDSNSSGLSLVVTPTAATVQTGSSFRFTATVTGGTNQAVIWRLVSGPGTIDGNGNYTAPATIAADTVVAEIRALAQGDTTLSVLARISIVTTPVGGGGGGGGGGSTAVCFERDIQPIFASNCAMRAGCHSTDRPQEGFILTSYSGISAGVVPGNPDASIIYRMITGKGKDGDSDGDDDEGDNDVDDGDDDVDDNDVDDSDVDDGDDDIMPPPPNTPLSPAQIELIRRWIAEGASGEPCAPPTGTGCDTTNITYSGVVSTILQNNCTGCHSGANPSAGLNLTTHAGVSIASANGRLVGAISHAPGFIKMPYSSNPADQKKLQECQILQIRTWVDRGAPNN